MKEPSEFEQCAQRLKALAEAERLRIVTCLLDGPANVGQIAQQLGEEIVKVSHHLGVLRHAGVVDAQKQGRFVIYRLHPDVHVKQGSDGSSQIEFGCCRLDLSEQAESAESTESEDS